MNTVGIKNPIPMDAGIPIFLYNRYPEVPNLMKNIMKSLIIQIFFSKILISFVIKVTRLPTLLFEISHGSFKDFLNKNDLSAT